MDIKTAHIVAFQIQIECPNCDEPIMNPETYGADWTTDALRYYLAGAGAIDCSECGATVKLPKTATLG